MVGAARGEQEQRYLVERGLELLEEIQRRQPILGVWRDARRPLLDRLEIGDQATEPIDAHQTIVEHPLQVVGGGAQPGSLHARELVREHEQPSWQRRVDPLASGDAGFRLRLEHADHFDRHQGKALPLVTLHRQFGNLLVREQLVGPDVALADEKLQIVERLLIGDDFHHLVVACFVPAPETDVGVRREVAQEGKLRPRSAPGGIRFVVEQHEVAAEAAIKGGGDGAMANPSGQLVVEVALQLGELIRRDRMAPPAVAVGHDYRERRTKLVLLAPVLDEAALQAGGGCRSAPPRPSRRPAPDR